MSPPEPDPENLVTAVQKNQLEDVKAIFKASSKPAKTLVNTANKQNLSLLYLATWYGHEDMVKYLLQFNPDVWMKDKTGYNVLHVTANKNFLSIAKLLLDHDKTLLPDVTDNNITPLYAAAYYGHTDIVKLFLKAEADVNIKTKVGFTAAQVAASNGHLNALKAILEAKPLILNDTTDFKQSMLHLAVKEGQRDVVSYLLGKGINKGLKDANEKLAINLAKDDAMKELLTQHEGKEDATKEPLTEPKDPGNLVTAVQKNQLEDVKAIFKASSKPAKTLVNTTNKQNLPLLYLATWYGHEDMVKYLLQFDPDVWIKDKTGYSVLHVAANKNFLSIAKLLLDHDKTLLHDVTDNNLTPLYAAAYFGHTDIVKLFLKAEADVNIKTKIGFTSAQVAASNGHLNALKAILEAKPQILNDRTKFRQSMLHLAAKEGHMDVAKYLASEGIDRDLQDKNEKRAIDVCKDEAMKTLIKTEWKPKETMKDSTSASAPTGDHFDVMLSYQWDSQPFVLQLKDFLETQGLTVWIDVQEMHGHIIKRMQEAVKNSSVIILCMTKKYECSANCSIEYNYAFKKKKEIIPIKLENFEPENELEIYTMNKLYYSFFNENEIEANKLALLGGIRRCLNNNV